MEVDWKFEFPDENTKRWIAKIGSYEYFVIDYLEKEQAFSVSYVSGRPETKIVSISGKEPTLETAQAKAREWLYENPPAINALKKLANHEWGMSFDTY